jgi:hypothetical protein
MNAGVEEIVAMEREGLVVLWGEVIGGAPPRRLSTPFLRRILAFEVQTQRHGGLSAALQIKLASIAAGKDRHSTPKLRPGGRLIREWNGVSHVVDVTEDAYLWRGARHRSLSAIARAITGAHWSGPRFFGLNGRAGQ